MKNIITLAVSLFSLTIFAQVGINNNTPKATLDITAQTTNGSKPEGLLPPRLTGDQIQAGDAQYTAAQAGIIIYATAAATAPSTKTANITVAGYYFYDGTAWQKLTSGAAVADATTTAKGVVQLAGDLSGTAASPAIAADAVTSAKILDGTVANADLATGTGGIYKGSGSLSGNTTVTQGANTLAFTSTATNGFSVDGTTLSVDAANNKVGIGTASPNATLDIRTNPTSTTDPGTGMLGIGTSTATASAAGSGAIRYDNTAKKLVYSDGANWVDIASNTNNTFSAYVVASGKGTANQTTFGGGVFYKWQFQQVLINDGNWNTSTNRYTAVLSGFYQVNLSAPITATQTSTNSSAYMVSKNGTLYTVGGVTNYPVSSTYNFGGGMVIYLTAGQYIEVGSFHCAGCSNSNYTVDQERAFTILYLGN